MKVLLISGAYGRSHQKILERNLSVYGGYSKYQFAFVVMATEPMDIQVPESTEFWYFDPSLKMDFLWKHQNVIRQKESDDFDLLVFSEDDALLSESNLDYFLEHTRNLSGTEYYPGFISYENWGEKRYLHSMTLDSWKAGNGVEVNGIRYWSVSPSNRMLPNIHQCCFLFDRKTFDGLISRNEFYVKPERYKYGRGDRYLGPRESATNWMWKLYYRKAWALDDIGRAFVLHCDHYAKHPVGPDLEEFQRTVVK